MVNTRFSDVKSVAHVNAPAEESATRCVVEAGVEEDLGVEAEEG